MVNICNFTNSDFIIFDFMTIKKELKNLSNWNWCKLTFFERIMIDKLIQNINEKDNNIKHPKTWLIPNTIAKKIKEFRMNIQPIINLKLNRINEIMNHKFPNKDATWVKLCEEYTTHYPNKTISISTMRRYLKKLKYSFRKSTIKTSILLTKNSIIKSLLFIKTIVRAICEKRNWIFCDESNIWLWNNHVRRWRKPKEEIYFSQTQRQKWSLIAGIGDKGYLFYQLAKGNTNSKIFINFIKELTKDLNHKNIIKPIIVLDNAKYHKSKIVKKYLKKNKINIIYNVPYASSFNAIELLFRDLKNRLYKKIFSTIEEVEMYTNNLLQRTELNELIPKLMKETLEEYWRYYDKYKNENYNSYKSEI